MAKIAKGSQGKKEVVVDLRKVKELQPLLKTATEGEAVRMAINESVQPAHEPLAKSLFGRAGQGIACSSIVNLLGDSSVFIAASH